MSLFLPVALLKQAWEAAPQAAASATAATGTAVAAVGRAAQTAGRTVAAAAQTATAAVDAVVDTAVLAGDAVGQAVIAAGEAAGEAAKAIDEAAASAANAVAEAHIYVAKTAEDLLASSLATGAVRLVKANDFVLECITQKVSAKTAKPEDGQFMGKDCPETSAAEPSEGVKPSACQGSGKQFPKIIYTNGINTPPSAACATMRKIADSRCCEVIGIYNATDGILGDVANANGTVDGDKVDEAAYTLSESIQKMSKKEEKIEIFAHSEGGLNAQMGLDIAKTKMISTMGREFSEKSMKNISVTSFGTARYGWPQGPIYTQYTNFSDPVPHVIAAAQSASKKRFRAPTDAKAVTFNNPKWNPIEAHSMDDTYLEHLNHIDPVPKGPNGSCC